MPLFNLLIVLLFTCGILIVKSMPIDEDLNSFVPERKQSNNIADQSSEVVDNDSPPADPKLAEENNNSDEQDYPYVYDIGGEEPLGDPVDEDGAADSIENTIEDYSLVDLNPDAPTEISGGVESLPNSNDESIKEETVEQSGSADVTVGSADVNVDQSGSADVVVDADATPPETPKDEDSSFFGSIADLFSSDDESSAETDEDRSSDDDLDIVPRKSDDSDIETDISTDIETESEPFDVDQSDFEDSPVEEPETNQPNLEDFEDSSDDDEVVTEEEGSISKSVEEIKEEEMIEEDLEDDVNDDVFVNDEQEASNDPLEDEPKGTNDLVVDDARLDDDNDEAKDSDNQSNDETKDNDDDDRPTEEVKTDEEDDEFDKKIEIIDEIIMETKNDELYYFDDNGPGDDSDDDSDFETKSKRGIEVKPDSEVSTQNDLSKGTGVHNKEEAHTDAIHHEDTAIATHAAESVRDRDDIASEHSKVHLTHSSDHHVPSPDDSHHKQRKDHVNQIQTLSDQVPQFDIFVKPPYADPPVTDITKRNILPIRTPPRPPPATPPLPLPLVPLQNALNKIPKPENILKLVTGLLPIPGAVPLNIPGLG